ncbi:MAG: hypothetical protein K2M40_03030, partial [Muribaculaceae bacterium]|nr:hypothetical protein [Muribaculaceae bacterium]
NGPTPVVATAAPGTITIELSSADGLTTSDGLAPGVFEIAGIDEVYRQATAEIIDNKIILTNMNVENPRFARYAWQPFAQGNLVNGDGLPASPSKSKPPISTLSREWNMAFQAPFAAFSPTAAR